MDEKDENFQKEENAVVSDEKKRRKKLAVRATVIIGALLFTAAVFVAGFAAGAGQTDKQERSLLWMIDQVERNYREEVSRDDLFDRLYDALELDRFCTHYTPEELADTVRKSNGLNEGYGISLVTADGAVRVSRVIQNSPAALAGLGKGMYVYSFDGTPAETSTAVADYLRGRESATLSCGTAADGSDARDIFVRRAQYLAAYCSYADSGATFRFRGEETLALTQAGGGIPGLPADTAYISLDEFEGKAGAEFVSCLETMRARGRKNLILDLRGNGGGYLSILCEIAAHLLRNAQGSSPLMARVRYRSGQTADYHAAGNDFSAYFSGDSQIRVLADENTASASEALMGALIDYGTCGYGDFYIRRGESGARTFGKGVMQSRFTAPDGNALVLTVADVFWPDGENIHGKGITEEMGASPVAAPLLPGSTDTFLESVLRALG